VPVGLTATAFGPVPTGMVVMTVLLSGLITDTVLLPALAT
jgi:hypothetical protein